MPDGNASPVLRFIRRLRVVQTVATDSDPQCLERFIADGDQSAFATLTSRHGPMVFSVCRRVLRNQHDAEDAFQATFLVLARKANSVRKRDSLASWLYGVAYRTACKASAGIVRRRVRESQLPTPAHQAGSDVAWNELRAILDEELNQLPEKYRAPLILCYLEGRTNEEAAEQLGWTKGTVSGRLARARDQLRQRLTRRGLTLSAGMLVGLFGAGVAPAAVSGTLMNATSQAAVSYAAGQAAAGPVTVLAEGVIRAMFLSKCKWIMSVVLALCLMSGGAGVLAQRLATDDGDTGDSVSAQAQNVTPAQPTLAKESKKGAEKEDEPPQRTPAKLAADKTRSLNNLKIIGIAMHNHHDAFGKFPAQAIYSRNGKPLLSWRVAILPFIEQEKLYKSFNLEEPWDSKHNIKLLAQMPVEYAPPGIKTKTPHSTFYRVFTGRDTVFDGKDGRKASDITDGLSNTVLVAEAGQAVPWTKPDELAYDAKKAIPKLGGVFDGDLNLLLADGSPRFVRRGFDEKTLRAAITRNGNEGVDIDGLNR